MNKCEKCGKEYVPPGVLAVGRPIVKVDGDPPGITALEPRALVCSQECAEEFLEIAHDLAFKGCLREFLEDSQRKVDEWCSDKVSEHKLTAVPLKRWIRIIDQWVAGDGYEVTSAWAFVDPENGNVYKPAGWKGPAKKHVRANVFDPATWVNIEWHGPKYLRR